MRNIRKRTRHCGRYGVSAKHIQVSYFSYTDRRKNKTKKKQRKHKTTTPKQRNLNNKRSKRYFEALVHSNFVKGDLHVTVTYDEKHNPADLKEAMRNVDNFIKRVNYQRKKQGLPPVKYVCVTEEGAKGRIHHHFIMDGKLGRDILEKKWGKGYCNADRLQPDDKKELAPLIGYLCKDPKGRKRWTSSHNLIKPWDSVNDDPRNMSGKKLDKLKDLPEDCEAAKEIIESDNPGYELVELEKEYREDIGQWYFFCRMKLKPVDKSVDKRKTKGKCLDDMG
ncbi:MAG: hypothetical protein IJ849_12190 [Selenomonadaceae bacterium]|nr:hypothetical protein [Selenomonadaceae bacterium]